MAAHDAVTLWDSLPRAGRKDEPNDEVVALVRVADGHLGDQHDTITEMFTVWNPLTREARWLPEIARSHGWVLDATLPEAIQRKIVSSLMPPPESADRDDPWPITARP